MKFTEDKQSQNFRPKQMSFAMETVSCPSCLDVLLDPKRDDCPSCGIVISQFKRVSLEKRLKLTVGGLYHLSSFDCEALEAAWRRVEIAYYDSESHNQFIHMCYRLKSLPYAAKKYTERMEMIPDDETADVMRKRVLLLSQESLPGSVTKTLPATAVTASLMRIFNAILVMGMIGGLVVALGSALTENKMYFFGLGAFMMISSLMSLLFMKHQLPRY